MRSITNKSGKQNVMVILLGLLLVGAIVYFGYNVSQSITGGDRSPTSVTGCSDSTGKLTVNSYSALSKSTNVTPTLKVGVNGAPVSTTATSGTTAFAIGDKLKIIAELSDYIDTEIDAVMACGGITVENPMFYSTSDNPSIRIKNDDGDYMTDDVAGGDVNQTDLSAGETLTLEVEFTGTSLESSGDGVYIVELPASTTANVTSIEMAGLSKTSVPSVHSLANAGSKFQAFDVPAIEGSAKKTYTLTVSLGASKDLAGGVLTDWYAKQKFVDTDGTIKFGVENSDGTAKYENSLDFDFYIN